MNTGTPLDLTAFGSLLRSVGVLYWLLVLVVLFLSLKSARGWRSGLWRAAIVLVVMVGPVGAYVWNLHLKQQAAKARIGAATARFEDRCKQAGAKIYRTVDDVEGVQLLNVRPEAKPTDRSDPNWADAALPNEGQGDWYIRTFLFWEHREDKRMPRGYLNDAPSSIPGYRYVDVKGTRGEYTRYRLGNPPRELSREQLGGPPARYAIGYTNLTDPDDRRMWIAGTKVTVTDTSTGEVMAESTWFSMDPGQGSTAGFRAPWGFARTCPELKGWVGAPTRFFVDTVLKPIKEG